MLLGEFYELIRTTVKRGATINGVLPVYAKLALTWVERNYTFKYMELFKLLQLEAGDRTVALPQDLRLKSLRFVRLINETGEYDTLPLVEPQKLLATYTGKPTGFWMNGISHIVFDNTPDEDLNGEGMFIRYTDWPVADNHTHHLLDIAPDVIMYQTLKYLAAYLRDAELVTAYKVLQDEALNTLTRAEDELKFDGQPNRMVYRPPFTQ